MNLVTMHLSRLTDFSGRENRQPFWLWVLAVYIAQMALSFLLMIPLMLGMSRSMEPLMQHDQAYLNAHPEIANQLVFAAMAPMMRNMLLFAVALGLVLTALLAAAVVRRLHDTNRSGYWALPHAILQLVMLGGYGVMFPHLFAAIAAIQPGAPPEAINSAFAGMMPLFALTWLAGVVGFIYMIVLIVFLASRGTVGPNHYGDDLLPPPVIPYWQQPGYQQPYDQQPYWQLPGPPSPPPPARVVGPWSDPPRP